MKTFEVVFYEDGVKKRMIVEAESRREAMQKAWNSIDADDIYLSEVRYET